MKASENPASGVVTVEELKLAIQKGWNPKWLFFWGHQPAKDGAITASCFSQWWAAHPFVVDDVQYKTAEHYMMAEKARLFGDEPIRGAILNAPSPAAAKALGRKVAGFDEAAWKTERWNIVTRGNTAKFGQHPELQAFLLHTGDRVLVEASPYDRIWGIGRSAKDAEVENPDNWKGLNLLGFVLMEVRHRLQKSRPKTS